MFYEKQFYSPNKSIIKFFIVFPICNKNPSFCGVDFWKKKKEKKRKSIKYQLYWEFRDEYMEANGRALTRNDVNTQ